MKRRMPNGEAADDQPKTSLPPFVPPSGRPPCHDPATGWDCPHRCGGCQTSCAEWKTYDEEKRRRYASRWADRAAQYARRDSFERAWVKKYRTTRT
ncbi:MAG: hypothetical protein IJY42_05505, partial [Clostridia bacterium]|nr:hypothetical protein [Clostridia bacterium]